MTCLKANCTGLSLKTRPTLIEMNYRELEKKFGRTQ